MPPVVFPVFPLVSRACGWAENVVKNLILKGVQSTKKVKIMAKVMTIGFENMDKLNTVEAVLTAMGIKYIVEDLTPTVKEAKIQAQAQADDYGCSVQITAQDGVEVVATPKKAKTEELNEDCKWLEDNSDKNAPKLSETKKTEKKAKTKKTSTKRTTKTTDDFDTELYRKVAGELGVIGKKGAVYKFARKTVYDGMSEVKKSKSGKLTAKVKKALMAQLLTEAKAKGLQWYIDSVTKAAKAQ